MSFFVFFAAMISAHVFGAEDCPKDPRPLLDSKTIELLVNSTGCKLIDTHMFRYERPPLDSWGHGKLSPFWAQEAIGADLTDEFLKKYDAVNPKDPSKKVPVGVVDGGFDLRQIQREKLGPGLLKCRNQGDRCALLSKNEDHGTDVSNLIFADPPLGVSRRSVLTHAGAYQFRDRPLKINGRFIEFENISEALTAMNQDPAGPKVVNFSISFWDESIAKQGEKGEYWKQRRIFEERLRTLSKKAIPVLAAGNDYPKKLPWMAKESPAVVVGSLMPNGLMSEYSSSGDEVTVSAPSGFDIQTVGQGFRNNIDRMIYKGRHKGWEEIERKMKVKSFSGTSAAAPLVTGALANVFSLLPDLSLEDAKFLIKKTALPTAGAPGKGRNGAGALNAYGMIRVAERIKALRAQGLEVDVRSERVYDELKGSAAEFKKRALKILGDSSKHPGDPWHLTCDQQREAFAFLRRAVFLDPDDVQARNAVARFYRMNGFDSQADYFEVRSEAEAFARMKSRFPSTLLQNLPQGSGSLGYNESFDLASQIDGMVTRFKTALRTGNATAEEIAMMGRVFPHLTGEWPLEKQRQLLAYALHHKEAKELLPLLSRCDESLCFGDGLSALLDFRDGMVADDQKEKLRGLAETLVSMKGKYTGVWGIELARHSFPDDKVFLKQIFDNAVKSPLPEVRFLAAAYASGLLPSDCQVMVKALAAGDPDSKVREQAKSSLTLCVAVETLRKSAPESNKNK